MVPAPNSEPPVEIPYCRRFLRITAGSREPPAVGIPTTGGYPQEPPAVGISTGGSELGAGTAGALLPTLAYRRFHKRR